jgi:hypothetical protein
VRYLSLNPTGLPSLLLYEVFAIQLSYASPLRRRARAGRQLGVKPEAQLLPDQGRSRCSTASCEKIHLPYPPAIHSRCRPCKSHEPIDSSSPVSEERSGLASELGPYGVHALVPKALQRGAQHRRSCTAAEHGAPSRYFTRGIGTVA